MIDPLGQRSVERMQDQGTLPGTGDARYAGKKAQGDFYGDVFEVVCAGLDQGEMLSLGFAADPGDGNVQPAGQILAGERIFRPQQFLGRSAEDEQPSVDPGSRSKVQ